MNADTLNEIAQHGSAQPLTGTLCPRCGGEGMIGNGHPDPQLQDDAECPVCVGAGVVTMCGHADECGEIASYELSYRDAEEPQLQTVRVCDEHRAALLMTSYDSHGELVVLTDEELSA